MPWFRKNYIREKGKITVQEYKKYIQTIIGAVKSYAIEGGVVILPYKFGMLYMERHSRDGLKTYNGETRVKYIDWKSTYEWRKKDYPNYTRKDWIKEENKNKCLIYYNNDHTNGMVYRINFEKTYIKPNPNIKLYTYKPLDRFKKQFGKYLKSNIQLPNYYERNKDYEYKFNYGTFIAKVIAKSKNREGESN